MQFPTDTDLDKAIAAPAVSIRPLLEFDWLRDGTFTTSAYCDQSELVDSVDVDFSSLHSDLPSEINTVVGSSSAVMTAKLSGIEGSSGMYATQLWSKYYVPSPLFSLVKEGTPVRYSRIVQTESGPRTIRQFTGWVSQYLLDEATDTVTLTCSDVYDLQTSIVTLPVWARGPDASLTFSPGPSGKTSAMTPIDVAWVYKNVLRQAGRSIWPIPRPDAVVMWPCDGSMLPTVGELGCALNIPPAIHTMSALFQDYLVLPIQVNAPYGTAPFPVSGTQNDDLTTSSVRATTACYVIDRGSSDVRTTYVGFAGWVKSTGSPGATGAPTSVAFYLGTAQTDEGFLLLLLYPGGSFDIRLYESSLSGSSNAGTTRVYSWVSAGNSLPSGWHYLEVVMSFTNSSISVSAKIDGVSQAPTGSPISTAAFKYHAPFTFEEQSNQAYVQLHDTTIQHFQIYFGYGTPPAVAGQKDPPYVTQGKPQPARTSYSTNWLTHLPEVNNTYGWDVLKEAVEGELGVILTREDGSVWIMGRDDAYFYAWLPSVGNNLSDVITQAGELGLTLNWFGLNTDLLTDPAQDLSRAKISGLQYNPSADTYRNAISYHVDLTKMINAIVWSSNDPTQFFAPSGSTNLQKDIGLPSGTVSIYNHTVDVGIVATANKPPLDQTSISAIQAPFPTFAASAGWLASVFWRNGQRFFNFGYGAGILSPGDVYIGAASEGDQANFQIGGWKYDNSDPFDEIYYTISEVATHGYVLLDLGSNPWRQYPPRLRKIFDSVLRDTIAAVPVLHNLSVPVDPRRQLLDVVKLPRSRVVSGEIYAQVVGKRLSDTHDSAQDFIDVRVIVGPVDDAYWDVASWDQSSWGL